MRRERLDRDYFENLYEESTDPWGFETSEYERRKYERTLGALGERRFRRALEVGSSIGVFTAMLAPWCDELLAVDASEKAVELARERLAEHGHVRVEEDPPRGDAGGRLRPHRRLGGPVLLAARGRARGAASFRRDTRAGGVLVAVHWRKETKTYPLQGDEVHELLVGHTRLTNVEAIEEPDYRLDVFENSL